MKKCLLALLTLLPRLSLGVDPVADYGRDKPAEFVGEYRLYMWTAAFGKGKVVAFVTAVNDYQEALHKGELPFWTPYMKPDGGHYTPSKGVHEGTYVSQANDVGIDPRITYRGF